MLKITSLLAVIVFAITFIFHDNKSVPSRKVFHTNDKTKPIIVTTKPSFSSKRIAPKRTTKSLEKDYKQRLEKFMEEMRKSEKNSGSGINK